MRTLAEQPVRLLFKHNILVAAHRGTVDTLRTRPASFGWLGALEALPAQRELQAALEPEHRHLLVLLF